MALAQMSANLAQMSANARNRLQTAFDRGDVPYVHNDLVYIGRGLPPLKLRSRDGPITTAGRAYEMLLAQRGDRGEEEHLSLFPRGGQVIRRGRRG